MNKRRRYQAKKRRKIIAQAKIRYRRLFDTPWVGSDHALLQAVSLRGSMVFDPYRAYRQLERMLTLRPQENARVAQGTERQIPNLDAAGSIPAVRTTP